MSISGIINYFMTNLVAQSVRASASVLCRAEYRRLRYRLTHDFLSVNIYSQTLKIILSISPPLEPLTHHQEAKNGEQKQL